MHGYNCSSLATHTVAANGVFLVVRLPRIWDRIRARISAPGSSDMSPEFLETLIMVRRAVGVRKALLSQGE